MFAKNSYRKPMRKKDYIPPSNTNALPVSLNDGASLSNRNTSRNEGRSFKQPEPLAIHKLKSIDNLFSQGIIESALTKSPMTVSNHSTPKSSPPKYLCSLREKIKELENFQVKKLSTFAPTQKVKNELRPDQMHTVYKEHIEKLKQDAADGKRNTIRSASSAWIWPTTSNSRLGSYRKPKSPVPEWIFQLKSLKETKQKHLKQIVKKLVKVSPTKNKKFD